MDQDQLDRIEENQQRIIALLENLVPAGSISVQSEIAFVRAQGLDPVKYLQSRAQKSKRRPSCRLR